MLTNLFKKMFGTHNERVLDRIRSTAGRMTPLATSVTGLRAPRHRRRAQASLGAGGKSPGEKTLRGFAFPQPLAEPRRARRETVVRKARHRGLEGVDPVDGRPDPVQHALVVRAEHLFE